MRLVTPMWDGVSSNDVIVRAPSDSDIEMAVRSLNGRTRNDLYLTTADETDWGQDDRPWLGVCGGPDVFNVSYNVTADDEFYTVVQRQAGDEVVEIVCGGQSGEFPRYMLVGVEVAVAVAVRFAANGQRLETVDWERAE